MVRFSIKIYLLSFLGALVVLYQYHQTKTLTITPKINIQEYQIVSSVRISKSMQNTSNYLSINDKSDKSISMFERSGATSSSPTLYIITPTYRRPEQLAELTRLSHTLMHVNNVHWLVIEDADERNPLIADILHRAGIKFEHLIAAMPEQFKKRKKGPKPRGVSNRNRGLEWIRQNANEGVFYFADDDNTYDLQLFSEMRKTRRVSMFPVGLITRLGVSTPLVQNGKFIGFYDGWMAGRKFPVDMAGFAISVEFLLTRPNATMPYRPGYEEDGFLRSLQPFEPKDIELLAENCTKILVWHTQAKKNAPSHTIDLKRYNNTNLLMLKRILV